MTGRNGPVADHWLSLNDGFSRLTSRSLETGVCLFLAQTVSKRGI